MHSNVLLQNNFFLGYFKKRIVVDSKHKKEVPLLFKDEYTTPSKNTGTWKKNYATKIKFSSFGNHGRNIRGISGLRGRLMDLMGLTTGTLRVVTGV